MKHLVVILILLATVVILSGCGHHGMHRWLVDSPQKVDDSLQGTWAGSPA